MQTRLIIITIVAALLLFSAASNAVYAKGQVNLINELTEIDSFHPPATDDPRIMMYNE
jgi:ABC-type oligopeptide transport system substrate-binding subunit